MSYTISQGASGNSVVDALTYGISRNTNYIVSSSNQIQNTVNVFSNTWTQLSLGQLADVRLINIWNDNTTYSSSFISIASGSNGQNLISVLPSNTSPSSIWWSGSLSGLYAKITSGTDNTGSIQYWVAQS